MATTFVDYTGDGNATKSFSFPSIKEADIKVEVDNVIKTSGNHYNITSYTTTGGGNVVFTSGNIPASPAAIRIFRDTDVDAAKATFVAGSSVKAGDLNNNMTQVLYAAQEEQNQTILTSDIKDAAVTTAKIKDANVTTAKIAADNITAALIADDQINSEHYVDGSIDTAHIADSQVTTAKIADSNVTTAKIADSNVTTAKIANSNVTTAKIADSNVTTAKIADSNVTTAKIAADAITAAKIADDVINSEHYAAGSIDTEHIADGQVTHVKLANDAVDGDNISDDSINSEHYVDGSIDTAHIADSQVTTAKIADSNVTTAKVADSNITTAKIADSNVTTAKIATDAITGAKIADDAINSEHYTDGSIDTAHIADLNVTTAKIAADAVTNAKIADDSIDSEHYVDGSIDTAHIGNSQVTTAKIAADNITNALIADDQIDSEHYVDGSIDTAHIGSAQVTDAKLASNSVITSKITDANVTTVKIADSNITLAKLASDLKQTSISNSDTQLPTSGAVVDYVAAQIAPLGGLEVIATEVAFPNTQPSSGVVISISDAGGVVFNGSGVSTTGRTVGGSTVTINGAPSSLYSETLAAGVGLMVSSTGSSQTYNYHKILGKESDIKQLSDDINDFAERYRVGSSNPTSSLHAGDLFFNTGSQKLLVYNATNSAWEETQTVGNFFINTISSSSGTGGGSATFNGSAYRFTISNAGTYAQQHLVSINGVIQKPNTGTSQPSEGFAIDGGDIIFSSAPASGADYFIITIGASVSIGTPSDGTVSAAKLASGAVTTAKIADSAVTSAKIADGAIVNADINASAAIAGSKISPSFGTQNITSGAITTSGALNIESGDPTIYLTDTNNNDDFSVKNDNGTFKIIDETDSFTRFQIHSNGTTTSFSNHDFMQGIDVTGAITSTGDITITNAIPRISFVDSGENPDWEIGNINGAFRFQDTTNSATWMQINTDGHVDVNGNLDVGAGIDVTGNITVSGTVDGVDIAALNTTVGNITTDVVSDTSPQLGGDLDTNSHHILFDDSHAAKFGDGNDLQIYHDSNVNYIGAATTGQDIFFKSSASSSLDTTSFVVRSDGSITHPDNIKSKWGAGDDLRIFHDGNHSYIQDAGIGALIMAGSNVTMQNAAMNANMFSATENGSIDLYFNGAKVFETLAAGVKVQRTTASTSYIEMVTSGGVAGYLYGSGNNEIHLMDREGHQFFKGIKDGAAELYYDNVKKFETSNVGTNFPSGSRHDFTSTGHSVELKMHSSNGSHRGSVYADNGDTIGFLRANGTWASRWHSNAKQTAHGDIVPNSNNAQDLGTSSYRWRNVYTNDLHLSNEGSSNDVDSTWGDWTIQEGESDLFLKNNRSGKKYKFNLTEVS